MNLFSTNKYSRQIYLSGIFLLVIGLPLSMFLMSIAQFVLLGAWLLDGNIVVKLKRVFRSPVFWVLAGVYLMHLLGLIYTTDYDYAFRDLRIKLPLLLLPLLFISSDPLEKKYFDWVLKIFIAAVITSSIISIAVYAGLVHKELHDIRDISIFISHIRLALLVCVAVTCCIYFFRIYTSAKIRILLILIIIYLISFLILLESLTGLSVLMCLATLMLYHYLFKQSRLIGVIGFVVITTMLFIGATKFYQFVFVDSIKQVTINYQQLPQKTALGNTYVHDASKHDIENGNLVWVYVCEKELDSAWNKRSRFLYSGKDEMGQYINHTLIRFLASKNLTRDAAGVNQLSDAEVRAIETGIANANDQNLSDVGSRMHQLAWEYRQYYYNGNPSGHSVVQRFEFWKTAVYIISKHPLIGVGTGDVQKAFDVAYDETDSKLDKGNRFKSHNQYLSLAVTFGICGGIYFIFSLFFPILSLKKPSFLYSSFLLIALLSMLTEDTLETQAGVTFFAFLNVFFFTQNSKYPEMKN